MLILLRQIKLGWQRKQGNDRVLKGPQLESMPFREQDITGTSMNLRHRSMQPGDIRECVDLLASDPLIASRYGPLIEELPAAWLRLLQCEANFATVCHAEEGPHAPICFFGVAAALQDEFIREMKASPQFWVGPELTRRMMTGQSAILTYNQLREANSRGGLNLVVWEGLIRPGYEVHGELQRYMMEIFIQAHRGYLWKEIIAGHPESQERLEHTLKTGGYLWDPIVGSYTSTLNKDSSEIVGHPHILGITRELELKGRSKWAGSWVGALFDYHTPMLGFNRREQRLLSCAIQGATDEHLTRTLGTSLPAVKKTWVSIYRRVEGQLPGLMPESVQSDSPVGVRGREKRRRLLAYLREHLEELRPVSRKLLARALASRLA